MKSLELFNEIKDELSVVENELKKIVQSPDDLLTKTSGHLLEAGGKRLRPAFALLTAKFYNYDFREILPLAVALELIHMATLVHDDVIDASMTRRGIPTVKARWGNQISIYTGDYLFAQSLILISRFKYPVMAKILADVSVKMCEGEIQQIVSCYDTNQSIKDYFYRINRKTALLISASCQLGAIASDAPEKAVRALALYGHYLGMAFQITDDILDLTANQRELGKPVGGDLRQGIITLPIIYALQRSSNKGRLLEILKKKNKTEKEVMEAITIVRECGAIEDSFKLSDKYLQKAKKQLEVLPPVQIRAALAKIADFVNKRKY